MKRSHNSSRNTMTRDVKQNEVDAIGTALKMCIDQEQMFAKRLQEEKDSGKIDPHEFVNTTMNLITSSEQVREGTVEMLDALRNKINHQGRELRIKNEQVAQQKKDLADWETSYWNQKIMINEQDQEIRRQSNEISALKRLIEVQPSDAEMLILSPKTPTIP